MKGSTQHPLAAVFKTLPVNYAGDRGEAGGITSLLMRDDASQLTACPEI